MKTWDWGCGSMAESSFPPPDFVVLGMGWSHSHTLGCSVYILNEGHASDSDCHTLVSILKVLFNCDFCPGTVLQCWQTPGCEVARNSLPCQRSQRAGLAWIAVGAPTGIPVIKSQSHTSKHFHNWVFSQAPPHTSFTCFSNGTA